MVVAVVVEISSATQLQPGFGIAFGIEFDHLHPVCGDIGKKRNVVIFRHGVMDGDKMLILHALHGDAVVIVRRFCFGRGQCDAAAADDSVTHTVDDIATDGADIEFAPEHIGGNVLVGDMLAAHQFDEGNAQGLSQRLQQGNVRQSLAGFPLGDGLAADTDPLCQLRLGQIFLFPQLADGGTGYIGVHGCHFLSEISIP